MSAHYQWPILTTSRAFVLANAHETILNGELVPSWARLRDMRFRQWPRLTTTRAIMTALILMSGGVDSYACAHFFKSQLKRSPTAFFVDYGQGAARNERKAFDRVAAALGGKTLFASLNLQRKFGTGLIPGRNGLLIMAALAIAPKRTSSIAIGIHSGTNYYDCSEHFLKRADEFVQEYSNGAVRVSAPFLHWSKRQIFNYCLEKQLDLSLTYSCEKGGKPCGKCASCRDRNAFDAR